MLALETSADTSLSRPYPLADLVAETQGLIGCWLQQAISNLSGSLVVALVSQTVVDPDDPAFAAPAKFVGMTYDEANAQALARAHGWAVAPDGSSGWRRVVASPLPVRIVETATADLLLRNAATVVLGGGGGVPVVETKTGLTSVEAVVDKDLVAAVAATALTADRLVILTDVSAVMADFGTPAERPLRDVTVAELLEVPFAAGSMRPKVAGACQFVERSGGTAAIGSLDDAAAVIAGTAGTQVRLS
jgi:carbamate kinase